MIVYDRPLTCAKMQANVKGLHKWLRSWINVADLIIICVSLGLELLSLLLGNSEAEVGGLLVVFRLWRLVRIMQAIEDVEHQVRDKEKIELESKIRKLTTIQEAQHTVIKEMHKEFVQRVRTN
jgi:hypothetical protein